MQTITGMKDSEQTIGNLVDKSSTAFISSFSGESSVKAVRFWK